MTNLIGSVIVGVIILILGISNMRGNISSLHWYHRRRVAEEDRLPFGRIVGIGTIIIGISIMLAGILSFTAEQTQNELFTLISSVVIAVGLVIGLGMNFFAMFKYNKGIF